MKQKQLIALITCNLWLFIVGNMLLTLLPVYAVELGMDEGSIGVYLGLAFAILTIGALASGWVSNRFQRHKVSIIVVCLLAIPATFLMGQVSDLALLTIFTLIVWFAAGLASSMVSILVGLYAAPHERGRIFGMVATSVVIGTVIAGFAAGAIVDRWGFNGLFTLSALIWVLPIISTLFIQDDIEVQSAASQSKPAPAPLSRTLWLLLVANMLVSITGFAGGFIRPLMMNELNFDASAISGAVGISSLVTLPVPFLVAWLSDRIGREQLLIISHVLRVVGVLLLLSAVELWQFWLSASLLTLAGAAGGVANALVTDLAPPQAISTALARFAATNWIAAIIGFSATGFIIQSFGLSNTVLLNGALPVLAIGILLFIMRRKVQPAPV